MRAFVVEMWVWVLSGFLASISVANTGVPRIALVIIDVQNCFLDGGTLAVAEGNQVIPVINRIRRDYTEHFEMVVLSQDWHCSDHVSFYTQHTGRQPYDIITLHYKDNGDLCLTPGVTSPYAKKCHGEMSPLEQQLWPPHCIIDSMDANFSSILIREERDIVVRKGYHCELDSYSAFYDNGGFGQTELRTILDDHKINTVYIVGLARDYCVYYTAKDAHTLGFKTYVIEDATRAVAEETGTAAIYDMKERGIHVIQSSDLVSTFPSSSTKTHFTIGGWWAVVMLCVLLY